VFHMDVTKVDQDVAYIAMVVHVCCKLLFPNVLVVFPDICCKCVVLRACLDAGHKKPRHTCSRVGSPHIVAEESLATKPQTRHSLHALNDRQ
jgi:hypothetical protein